MYRYGQEITWSTPGAPHPFSGTCQSFSYREQLQRQLDEDEVGDQRALILHSKKGDINFSVKISAASTNFLDLSSGAAITLAAYNTGVVLVSRAVERWTLGQSKTASIQATHYPDVVQADPTLAGNDLDAFTPDQAALGIVTPGGALKYGTFGLGHAAGVVHELEITQELTLTEDEPSPAGTIVGVAAHGYLRSIRLRLLAKAAKPAVGSVLVLTGAPSHGSDYKIESVEETFAEKRGKMYDIAAVWIPPMTVEG